MLSNKSNMHEDQYLELSPESYESAFGLLFSSFWIMRSEFCGLMDDPTNLSILIRKNGWSHRTKWSFAWKTYKFV